jgi:hypothetical protein
MKSRGRTKVGSSRGNPGYRTPSFFKNKPVSGKNVIKIKKILREVNLKSY